MGCFCSTQYRECNTTEQNLYPIHDESVAIYLHEDPPEEELDRRMKYTQLFEPHNSNLQTYTNNMYSFGVEFRYGYENEKLNNPNNCVSVSKKYSSLKQELTQNNILHMSIAQYNNQYHKALTNYDLAYCRQTYDHNDLTIEHILALMVYTNCTRLQFEFTKTYRCDELTHNEFYHMGMYLKQCLHT
eukprot:137296_1